MGYMDTVAKRFFCITVVILLAVAVGLGVGWAATAKLLVESRVSLEMSKGTIKQLGEENSNLRKELVNITGDSKYLKIYDEEVIE